MGEYSGMANPEEPNFDRPDSKMLVQIARMRMPFGRYAGTRLIDLPEPYVVWFKNQGFPKGRLGMLLGLLYEVKSNGLEPLFDELRVPKRKANYDRLEPTLRFRDK